MPYEMQSSVVSCSTAGIAAISANDHTRGFSTWPTMSSRHEARATSGVDKVFGNLIELVVRRDLLYLWPSVLCAVVPKGADRKKSPQYAAEEHRCGCSNSKSKKTAQTNRGSSNRLVLPRHRTQPWPIQQAVEENDAQSAYAERDQHFQRCD